MLHALPRHGPKARRIYKHNIIYIYVIRRVPCHRRGHRKNSSQKLIAKLVAKVIAKTCDGRGCAKFEFRGPSSRRLGLNHEHASLLFSSKFKFRADAFLKIKISRGCAKFEFRGPSSGRFDLNHVPNMFVNDVSMCFDDCLMSF